AIKMLSVILIQRFFHSRRKRKQKHEINTHVIGLSLEELKNIPTVVALANGLQKKEALVAALNAGLIDVIVITDRMAEYILQKND
ncbi:putative transcriptional regulator, partial [Listeria monocytogenes FSL F6-684]